MNLVGKCSSVLKKSGKYIKWVSTVIDKKYIREKPFYFLRNFIYSIFYLNVLTANQFMNHTHFQISSRQRLPWWLFNLSLPTYLETVLKLLADKVECHGVDAGIKGGHIDTNVV